VREVLAVWWYALPVRISTIEARTAGAATQSSARLGSLLRATEPTVVAEPTDLSPPVDGAITSVYGWRGTRMHNGIDFAAHRGQDVVAAAPGVVAYAGELEAYGHVVALAHGDGLSTVYAHLDEVLVVTSTGVPRGERIGHVGMTGNAFGPHLHFELRANGEPIDPLPHLGADVFVTPAPPRPSRGFVLRRLARTAIRSR
jgi:murein DD-endopeptidase MepM/ murein hydrolase activator NlpD